MPSIRFDNAFEQQVAERVARFQRRSVDDAGLTRAAVAVVLVGDEAGNACFVLTRRPLSLRRHAGQWALPGGRADEGEGPADTARRELEEEVGLTLDPASIVGMLDDYATRSGFVITPVVFVGPVRPKLTPDPDEVHAAHIVPLEVLDASEIPRVIEGDDGKPPLICLPVASLGTTIWAPTAALIYQMREVIVHGRSTRVAHFEQPRFAWK